VALPSVSKREATCIRQRVRYFIGGMPIEERIDVVLGTQMARWTTLPSPIL
jgi:hypothetical protein